MKRGYYGLTLHWFLEIARLDLVIVPDRDRQRTRTVARMTGDGVISLETPGRTNPARPRAQTRKIRMIGNEGDARKRSVTRGMVGTRRPGRRERPGKKRSGKRRRRRRCAHRYPRSRWRWGESDHVPALTLAESEKAQVPRRDLAMGDLRDHLRGRVSYENSRLMSACDDVLMFQLVLTVEPTKTPSSVHGLLRRGPSTQRPCLGTKRRRSFSGSSRISIRVSLSEVEFGVNVETDEGCMG